MRVDSPLAKNEIKNNRHNLIRDQFGFYALDFGFTMVNFRTLLTFFPTTCSI